MEINRNNINKIIEENSCGPDKDFGQNFLVEPNISFRITDLVKDFNNILEIGPGLGSLTHYLNLNRKNITVVDIDMRMAAFIESNYPEVNVICDDIRKVSVNSFEAIISNLPYNITTEVIGYLLCNARTCKKMVLMCQSETFAHFYDTKGSEYGPTSVLIHLVGTIKKELVVSANSFYPKPKCSSTVFSINLSNKYDHELIVKVFEFTKRLFINRRKTLLNNLTNVLGDKVKAANVLNECNISINKRPEEILPEQFMDLYIHLH